jgi:hypothetical protein
MFLQKLGHRWHEISILVARVRLCGESVFALWNWEKVMGHTTFPEPLNEQLGLRERDNMVGRSVDDKSRDGFGTHMRERRNQIEHARPFFRVGIRAYERPVSQAVDIRDSIKIEHAGNVRRIFSIQRPSIEFLYVGGVGH